VLLAVALLPACSDPIAADPTDDGGGEAVIAADAAVADAAVTDAVFADAGAGIEAAASAGERCLLPVTAAPLGYSRSSSGGSETPELPSRRRPPDSWPRKGGVDRLQLAE
jgi:hypothetical protein